MVQRNITYFLFAVFLSIPVFATAKENQEPNIPQAVVVIFENGDRLSGVITANNEGSISLTTEFGVSILIPRDKVKELQTSQVKESSKVAATLRSRPISPEHSTLQTANGNLVVNNAGSGAAQPDAGLLSQRNNSPTQWSLAIEPQASLTTGTQQQQIYGGRLYLNRTQNPIAANWRNQTTRLLLGINKTVTERPGAAPVRIHVYDGTLTHQAALTKNISAFGIAEMVHNSALRLYLQQSYGGGLGFDSELGHGGKIELLSDVRFYAQNFYPPNPTATFTGLRVGQGYSIQLPRSVVLYEKISYVHPLDLKDAWQIHGIGGVVLPINSNFSINFQLADDYFQNAANGRKNYLKSTIGIKFFFTRTE